MATGSHIALCVPDAEAAAAFYTSALDFSVLTPTIDFPVEPIRPMGEDVFGKGWNGLRFIALLGPDGQNLELFEFPGREGLPPPSKDDPRPGFIHLGFTVPDIDLAVARVEQHGGRRLTKTWEARPGSRFAYAADPFGSILEFCNRPFRAFWTA